MNKAYKTLLMD